MKPDNRRVACQAVIQVTNPLVSHNIELKTGINFCAFKTCGRPFFRVSGRCIEHLFDQKLHNRINRVHREKSIMNMKSLRAVFESTARGRWKFPPDYDIVRNRMFDIQQGRRAGSDLVILDDEFSCLGPALGICHDREVSSKVLINTCVEHKSGLDHRTWSENPFLQALRRSKASNVFPFPDRPRSIGQMRIKLRPNFKRLGSHKTRSSLSIIQAGLT
ncbi:hypothetical protein BDZ45DRAFT_28118 [Acephala macrosclerotiorum]|nr:hypothetical protein BDZ45DRAFT_28118 [Acephala macrosclerotiorum]